ncbi:MAG: Gfo/Idh/MocA family oxidoreductase [Deltaproteobacteria bacterium]|nr:Gfo/Idh/MocA family oxidoreductase [Deltaproteobacteria bacterium]
MRTNRRRVAVIGAGYLGRIHAQKYAMIKEAELVGVCDINHATAKEVAASVKTGAYASYKDLFGKVDAVSVAAPTESHCEIALEFLSRGVDVLVEKPITVTAREADLLISEAAKTRSVLQVGHLERFNPAVVALSARVKDPVYIEADRLSPFPNRSVDVDVILDVMIHDIDIILSLVKSDVTSVEAVGAPVITDKLDIANARLAFSNGCVAQVTASRVAKERVRKLLLYQHGGYMTVDYANQHISITNALPPIPGQGSVYNRLVDEEITLEKKDSILEELTAFVRCSAAKSTPPVTGSDGKRALQVAERIQKAVRSSMSGFRTGR